MAVVVLSPFPCFFLFILFFLPLSLSLSFCASFKGMGLHPISPCVHPECLSHSLISFPSPCVFLFSILTSFCLSFFLPSSFSLSFLSLSLPPSLTLSLSLSFSLHLYLLSLSLSLSLSLPPSLFLQIFGAATTAMPHHFRWAFSMSRMYVIHFNSLQNWSDIHLFTS